MTDLPPDPADLEPGMVAGDIVIEAYGTVTPPPDQPTPDQEN